MAIYSLNISTGAAGAAAKQAYIEREGKYADKGDLIAHGSMNLPSWAASSADFWREDEAQETGNQYREIKLALPKELDRAEQKGIVEDFCRQELDGHPLTWAIHENEGRLSGERNPHAHIMICERKIDPDRPEPGRDEYFRRSSRKKDGRYTGGYAKDREITGNRRKEWLARVRQAAEKIINRGLERAGRSERVSCRSLEAQGIDRAPQEHVGPGAVALYRRGIDTDRVRSWRETKMMQTEIARAEKEKEIAQAKLSKTVEEMREMEGAVPGEYLESLHKKQWRDYVREAREELVNSPEYQRLLARVKNRTATGEEQKKQEKMSYDIFDGNAAKWRAAEKWVEDDRFLQAPPCGFPPKVLPSADVSREMIRHAGRIAAGGWSDKPRRMRENQIMRKKRPWGHRYKGQKEKQPENGCFSRFCMLIFP